MYRQYNANPEAKRSGDCTVRAISKLLNRSWEEVYISLCAYGLKMYDMPSSNAVWGAYLADKGFSRHIVPNSCPMCYTVADFANDNPCGTYLLALNGHVVTVVDGCYFDSWDSGEEVVLYYWRK